MLLLFPLIESLCWLFVFFQQEVHAQIDHVDVIKMCDFFSFSFKTITKERFKMCSYEPKRLASGEIIIDLSPCSEQPEPLHPRGRDSWEGKPHPNEGFEAEITEGWKNGNVGNLGLLLFKVFYRRWSIPKTSIKSVNHEIL